MRKTTKKKVKEPVLVRFAGGVSKGPSSHPRYAFVVRWPGEGGRRLAKWFTNDTDALVWAKEKSAEAGVLGADFGSVSEDERAALAAFRAFAAKYENPKPPTLARVVDEFKARWEASRKGATVKAAVAAFLEAKKAEGRSAGHLATIGVRLNRFVTDHGERVLPSFTTSEISDYVLNLRGAVVDAEVRQPVGRMRKDGTPVRKDRPAAPRKDGLLSLETRAGYRRALHSLFEWALGRDMLPANPVTKSDKPTPKATLPGVLPPAEVAAFLAALGEHAPLLLPFWAVRTFAGVREAEALRMTWQMIDLKKKEIVMPATITKTRKPRVMAIQPALEAFLVPVAKQAGPLCPLSPMARRWHLRLAMRTLPELKLPRNWARHSFATYHFEAYEDHGKTAKLLGHRGNTDLMHERYVGVGTKEQALEFWAIRPAKAPTNVVPMDPPPGGALPEAEAPKRKPAGRSRQA